MGKNAVPIKCKIVDALRQERKGSNLTRSEIAYRGHISIDMIKQWESGRFFPNTVCGMDTLKGYIENGLGMKFSEFMYKVWIE